MAFESTALFNAISGVTMLESAGIIAGLLQIAGYIDYYRKVVAGEVDPNPLSWFMFAYGTFFLLILEWDAGASTAMMALPAACTLGSLLLAFNIWRKNYRVTKQLWPQSWRITYDEDGKSFMIDLVLTASYLVAGALASVNLWNLFGASTPLSAHDRQIAALWVLIASNISTFPGFGPIIRATKDDATKEHYRPWALWTAAYLVLLGVTWVDTSVSRTPESLDPLTWDLEYWSWLTLMFYPASCAYLHGRVSWLARPAAQKRHRETRLAVA